VSVASAIESTDVIGPVLRALPAVPATGREPTPRRQTLPVLPALAPLLPGGELRRGSTVAVTGSTALALALLPARRRPARGARGGRPDTGARAVAELGVRLDRLALIPSPGTQWAAVVAALFDGVDRGRGPPTRPG